MTPTPLGRLVLVELRKSVDTRSARWLLAVAALVCVVIGVLQMTLEVDVLQRSVNGAFLAQHGISFLLLPVVGILLVTSEWSRRTALTTYALVPRRSRVTVAKAGAAVLLAVGTTAFVLAVSVTLNLLAPLWSAPGRWDVNWTIVGQATLVGVVAVLGGVGFGMLLLSSPLAIVLYFVAPTVLTVLGESVQRLRAPLAWLDINETLPDLYLPQVSGRAWAQAGTSVLLWVVLPLLAGGVRTQRREVA
jgi:ABC-2 type transport system permease protein